MPAKTNADSKIVVVYTSASPLLGSGHCRMGHVIATLLMENANELLAQHPYCMRKQYNAECYQTETSYSLIATLSHARSTGR